MRHMKRPTEIQRLLEHGGWLVVDAQERRRAHPDTFELPSAGELAKLEPGSMVKVIFDLLDQADLECDGVAPYAADGTPNLVVAHERMWLWVEDVRGEDVVGVLDNMPMATHTRLVPGARVRFRRDQIVAVAAHEAEEMQEALAAMARLGFPTLAEQNVTAPEDPARLPTIPPSQAAVCARHELKPERPHPLSEVVVSKNLEPDLYPVYGWRTAPDPDGDSRGWIIWAGEQQLEDALERFGVERIAIGAMQRRHREAWKHLALPTGWAFVLSADGDHDVFVAEVEDEDGD